MLNNWAARFGIGVAMHAITHSPEATGCVGNECIGDVLPSAVFGPPTPAKVCQLRPATSTEMLPASPSLARASFRNDDRGQGSDTGWVCVLRCLCSEGCPWEEQDRPKIWIEVRAPHINFLPKSET